MSAPMTRENIETDYICHQCIRDPFLAKEVMTNDISGECRYCEKIRKVLPLDELTERIHEVLQAHYVLIRSQPHDYEYALGPVDVWVRPGDFVDDVIADIAGVSSEIATDVRELLSDRFGLSYGDLKDGEEEPYASDSCYEERDVYDWNFRETWETFRDEVRYRTRFFSAYAEEALTHIFGDLNTHKGFRRESVIHEVSPDDENSHFWRGRTAQSHKELEAILSAPAREIGPPPPHDVRGGRMNASGIPVFYGAMKQDTCVAEIRAPVGSHVAMAKFELLRPVRLLDFNALIEIYVDVSHFDPDYEIRYGRAAFLRSLVSEICRPVMPQDKVLEYLPTQAVAEYLANKVHPRLDGIIFPSSQTKGGHNVVLFNHACGVVPDDLPEGTDVKVCISGTRHQNDDEGDEGNDFIQVIENVTRSCKKPQDDNVTPLSIATSSRILDENGSVVNELPRWSKPTLRLDAKNVFVLDIKSVRLEHRCRKVFRDRRIKDES